MGKDNDFYQISLKVIIQNKKGEILALKGMTGGSYDGFYDIPGGRIDKKEFKTPLLKIIRREIQEEVGNIKYQLKPHPVALGRHLLPASLNNTKKDIHILYLFFEANYLSGNIKISREHLGHKWLKLNKNNLTKYFKSGNLEGIKMYLTN